MSTHIQRIIDLLFQVDKAMHEQLRDASEPAPLSLPDAMALSYLAREEAASITDMAAHFGIRKSSMSTKVSKLEKKGLIARSSCRFDRRSHTITLTPKAINLLSETKRYVAAHASPLFTRLNTEEQKQFISLLKKITTDK